MPWGLQIPPCASEPFTYSVVPLMMYFLLRHRETRKLLESILIWLLLTQQAAGKVVRTAALETKVVTRSVRRAEFWLNWSEWTSCSRSCGRGVSKRLRRCSSESNAHRRGQAGGISEVTCIGDRTQYRSCNTQKCHNARDFRAEQCLIFNHMFTDNDWTPYYDRSLNPCALNCHDTSKNTYSVLRPKVVDGTRCFEDPLEPGVCADGKCLETGCDGVIVQTDNPPAKYDACGVCGGSGNSCKVVAGEIVIKRPNEFFGFYKLLELPTGARNINVAQRKLIKSTKAFLALRNSRGQYYVNTRPYKSYHTICLEESNSFFAAGTIFNYTSNRDKHGRGEDSLHAWGVIQEPLTVLILLFGRVKFNVSYSYAFPGHQNQSTYTLRNTIPESEPVAASHRVFTNTCRNEIKPGKKRKHHNVNEGSLYPTIPDIEENEVPTWVRGGFQRCSVSCGGGEKVAQFECVWKKQRVDANICIPKQRTAVRPEPVVEKCNTHQCPAKWKAEKWSRCSQRCDGGLQKRNVSCQRTVDSVAVIVSPSLCPVEKPPSIRHCKTNPCIGTWTPSSPFGECSTSCGRGIRRRSVVCIGAALCDPDEKRRLSQEECCSASDCTKIVWFTGPWVKSVTCGEGFRDRKVSCHGIGDEQVSCPLPEEMCNLVDKPLNKENVTFPKCRVPGEWWLGPWSKCSESCRNLSSSNSATRSRPVLCMRGFRVVMSIECAKEEPPSIGQCPDLPACPLVCRDKNKEYDCKLINELELCHVLLYQKTCCATCTQDGRKGFFHQ